MAVEDERASLTRPLALCGFMGVGKSTIGRVVARELGRSFVDSDAVIVEHLGRSIPELFASGEEALFRASEAAVIAELLTRRPPLVVALGGGALENEATRRTVLDEALLIYIHQPFEDLRPALAKLRASRPLLGTRSEDEIEALYHARESSYEIAPIKVTTHRQGVRFAARQVLQAITVHHDA